MDHKLETDCYNNGRCIAAGAGDQTMDRQPEKTHFFPRTRKFLSPSSPERSISNCEIKYLTKSESNDKPEKQYEEVNDDSVLLSPALHTARVGGTGAYIVIAVET